MHSMKSPHHLQRVAIPNYASGMTALDPRGHWLIGIWSNPKLTGLTVSRGTNGASSSCLGTPVEMRATMVTMVTVHMVGSSNGSDQGSGAVQH